MPNFIRCVTKMNSTKFVGKVCNNVDNLYSQAQWKTFSILVVGNFCDNLIIVLNESILL
jgi:hypothetical protein